MTDAQQPQREHCEHECVCPNYFDELGFPCDGILIPQLNKREKCPDDTRIRPHTPAPEPASLREMPTLHDKERYMQGYREGKAEAASAATLAENTRCVKILEDYRFGLEYPDCPPGDCIKKLIESLRKAGGQG
jgi:hypothetical protein